MPNLKFTTDADLDALAAKITALESSKASQAALDLLAQVVAGKADQTALDALAARVTSLEGGSEPAPAPTPSPTPDPMPVPPPPAVEYGASINEDIPPTASGNVARYGGSEYPTLAAAISAAASGGVVEVLPGRHIGAKACPQYYSKALTIRGLRDSFGRAPALDAQGVALQKAILNPTANSIVEHLSLLNASTGASTGNAAGWRPEPSCLNAVLRFVIADNCQNGVLTPTDFDFSEMLLVEDSVFRRCGNGDHAHGVYLGYGKEVRFVRTTFKDHKGGHGFKSRAWRTIMDACLVEDRIGNRSLEVPIGGYFHFNNGKIVKYETATGNMDMIAFNNEGQGEGQNRTDYCLVENSILDARLSGHITLRNGTYSGTTAIMRNCQRPGSKLTAGSVSVQ